MEQDEDNTSAEDLIAGMKAMLDTAVIAFQREWGQEIKARREMVAMGMPPGFDALSQALPLMGISLSPEEIAQIEEGTFTSIDVRLLLAVCMVLEVGVEKAMITALSQGAAQHQDG
jgi:hypothetical protein